MTSAIEILNNAPADIALSMMEPLVERSAWVAAAALDARPFADATALAAALVEIILTAGKSRRLALFNEHPELAGREAQEGVMTAASTDEQSRLGLLFLSQNNAARLGRLNSAYRARFGHPFIIALHRVPDLGSLFDIFERRLSSSAVEEHVATLAEIASVVHSRAARLFGSNAQRAYASQPEPQSVSS